VTTYRHQGAFNGVLRRRVARGQPPAQAAGEVVSHLVAEGPVAFDPAWPADRSQAVAATIRASLVLLDPADQRRYLDLAIFPEDVDVPLDMLRLLWPGRRAEALCEELAGLGLATDYRLDEPGPRLVLHDVVRAYLRTCRSADEQVEVHRRLVHAAAGVPWWLLPEHAGYLWRYLPYHLHWAGRAGELAGLVGDLRWVEAKTRRFGSVVAAEADLELVDTPPHHQPVAVGAEAGHAPAGPDGSAGRPRRHPGQPAARCARAGRGAAALPGRPAPATAGAGLAAARPASPTRPSPRPATSAGCSLCVLPGRCPAGHRR
jgi:hypothetical protein